MLMYNLIEYSHIYSKTSESLCQYYRDEPAFTDDKVIIDFPNVDSTSISFKFKQQITR